MGSVTDLKPFRHLGLAKLICDRSLHSRSDNAQVTDTKGPRAYAGDRSGPVSGLGSSELGYDGELWQADTVKLHRLAQTHGWSLRSW